MRLLPIIVLVLIVAATSAWSVGRVDEVDLEHRFAPMSLDHPLGTDHLGRDLAARMAGGGLNGIAIVGATSAIGLIGGGLLAAAMLVSPPLLAAFMHRMVDLALTIPSLVLALVATAAVGASMAAAIGVLAVGAIAGTAHLAYGLMVAVLGEGHALAARALGCSEVHLVRWHLLPTVAPTLLLAQCYDAARVLLAWSALAFLGLGADPNAPDWGALIWEYRLFLLDHPRLVLVPMAAMTLLAWSLARLGDREEPWCRKRVRPRADRHGLHPHARGRGRDDGAGREGRQAGGADATRICSRIRRSSSFPIARSPAGSSNRRT